MTEKALWFIKGGTEHEVAEGGDFPITGFIGQLTVTHVYRLWTEVEPTVIEAKPDLYQQMGSGFVLYYADLDEAKEAQIEIGSDIDPQKVLYVEMPTDSIINFRDETALAKWGASVASEVRDVTLNSKKYRHEAHLIFLPSLIVAIANTRGWKNAGFDLSDLDISPGDFLASDELQLELVGDLSSKEGHKEGRYWVQREALFASLGEDDPDVYRPKGATITRAGQTQPSEVATTSDRLSVCLQAYVTDWTQPVYARLKLVPNPRVDAISGAGNRLTVPVIQELFVNKVAAEAARDADLEAMGIVGETPTPPEGIPASWADVPDEWQATITELKEQGATATVELAGTLTVSLRELKEALK